MRYHGAGFCNAVASGAVRLEGNAVSLFDFAHDRADDFSHALAVKRWQSSLLSAKLRDLRSRSGMTQAQVAERAGISETAVRNYELMRSTPKEAHLQALAGAFDIRPEALRVYDIDYIPAHALIQLGEVYGLVPVSSRREFAYLAPASEFVRGMLGEWAERYAAYREGEISASEYEWWKDRFSAEFDMADFPLRYERAEGGGWHAIEPWQNIRFASALRRLREKRGLTQEGLAKATGISRSTIRSYEQRRRLPMSSQLELIADVLGVAKGALTFFDFGSPVQASHALFQIANTYALVPDVLDEGPVLRTVRAGLEQIIDQWADELAAVEDGTAGLSYQDWKDVYDPEADEVHGDFRHAYHGRSRYSMRAVERGDGDSRIVEMVQCSDFDPYDGRFPEGFLRA